MRDSTTDSFVLSFFLQREPVRTVREWDLGKREQLAVEDGEGRGKGREGSQEGGRKEAERKRGSVSPGERNFFFEFGDSEFTRPFLRFPCRSANEQEC